jgi:hypothetical protein
LVDRQDVERHAYLTDGTMRDIADILRNLEQAVEEDGPLYLYGSMEVRHGDGYRIGHIASYEDWFVFVPDYKEQL